MYWFAPRCVVDGPTRCGSRAELACDDRVIAVGTGPREYAGHLLEIAYSFGGHRAPALAVTMARPRQLEGRMLAALDSNRNRQTPSRRTRVVLTVISVVVLAALSAVTLDTSTLRLRLIRAGQFRETHQARRRARPNR